MARVDRWARGKWVHCNWNAPIQNVAIRSSIQLVLFRPLKNQQCQVYGPEVWLLLLWTWMRRASGRARGWTLLRVLELEKVKSLPRRRNMFVDEISLVQSSQCQCSHHINILGKKRGGKSIPRPLEYFYFTQGALSPPLSCPLLTSICVHIYHCYIELVWVMGQFENVV